MAVSENLITRKLQIALANGTNADGTTKVATRSLSNINSEATAAQMHATAAALATLMDNTLVNIYYDDKKLLQEVEA